MKDSNWDEKLNRLEQKAAVAGSSETLALQSDVYQMIRMLKSRNASVPKRLQRLEAVLEQNAADDMYDNMPV